MISRYPCMNGPLIMIMSSITALVAITYNYYHCNCGQYCNIVNIDLQNQKKSHLVWHIYAYASNDGHGCCASYKYDVKSIVWNNIKYCIFYYERCCCSISPRRTLLTDPPTNQPLTVDRHLPTSVIHHIIPPYPSDATKI